MAQVAVIGLGRFGHHVARQLHLAGHDVLAIDISAENVQNIKDHSSRAVVLDARDKNRLDALGIRDFDVVVVSLGERIDASALVALHLKEVGCRRIVTKAGSEDHAKLLDVIGVHEIIFPEREAAAHLAHRLASANLLDYVPLGDDHSIHEMAPPEPFIGKTLEEIKIRSRFGIQVIGIRDMLTQEVHINPDPTFRIKDSDALLVLGRNRDLKRLNEL
ncbi:MAG TPA: TrkA family potassium uptake protein [Thermoanaerobaculia bacterium]|nr:TrkA family potassium uptake protein [Thermoanaerobaculia bacterium]